MPGAGEQSVELAVVGAGPCGLAAGIAATRAGISSVIFDRACVVSGIAGYPTYMTFFSTAERLSIGDVPFVVATEKPTRRDALAYYRALVKHFDLTVRQYEEVVAVERAARGDRPFTLRSRDQHGAIRTTRAKAVVIATGYFGRPNRLGVAGEDLPHVTHRFREGHDDFDRDVVVVGGGNSAVEAALELYRAGARVTLVHFGPSFDRNIKPWVLPDITNRVAEVAIQAKWDARVAAIEPDCVVVRGPFGEARIPAQRVYLMIGYLPETKLLEQLGVAIDEKTGIPKHDPATMATSVPGVFIAGVLASGYDANKTFIENGRGHGELIVRSLTARSKGKAAGNKRTSG
ncbi:MAG TPA: YpdA family putative bacillithiol disulfide reductase [Gemmatimonadaceae bacterium]|nr:YpdA family putative bacillithiol disulfide reductase [Gemmatimonadaceae bacterium]